MSALEDNPALNADGTLKDASDMVWQHSESEQAPVPNGVTPAPSSNDDESDDGLVAPGKVSSTVPPRRPRDLPDPALIVDGSRYRKPSTRTTEGKEKPGVGLRREINNFFHPKAGRCVEVACCMSILLY